MAAEKSNVERRNSSVFLTVLIAVCVLLIVINVTNALSQSSMNDAVSDRDIYTLQALETDVP
jgi:hypothetical protein